MSTFGAAKSVKLLHFAQKVVEGAISSDEVYRSSVVGSVVDEKVLGLLPTSILACCGEFDLQG